MSSRCTSMRQQAILEHYRGWLEATARQRSDFNGVLFATQCTTRGEELFLGLSVEAICHVIGANIAMAEQAWIPPPLVRMAGEQPGNA